MAPTDTNRTFVAESLKSSKRARVKAWLGQGRWNEQEHCCVYIASNVSFGFAFATDVNSPLWLPKNLAESYRSLSSKPSYMVKMLQSYINWSWRSRLKSLYMPLLESRVSFWSTLLEWFGPEPLLLKPCFPVSTRRRISPLVVGQSHHSSSS